METEAAHTPSARLEAIHSQINECRRCETTHSITITKSRSDFIRGDHTAKLIAIGEAPGSAAINGNKAFAGNSFARLLGWFRQAGYDGDEEALRKCIYFTSLLKCKIEPNQRNTIFQCFSFCSTFLWQQIDIIKPFDILLLGKSAFETITGQQNQDYKSQIGSTYTTDQLFEGQLFWPTRIVSNWHVLPHPSGLNRLHNDKNVKERIASTLRNIVSRL